METTKSGIELIAQERREQIEKHGYSAEHDNGHCYGEIAKVAAVLAVMHTDAKVNCPDQLYGSNNDPWGLVTKIKGDKIKALTVAGALIAAELDRLNAINS